MECRKCEVSIPSEFEFVIAKNMCPKCGNKLMIDAAMKVYIDLKKKLQEVEFVMDKTIVCERIAMFMITNYEVIPLGQQKTVSTTNPSVDLIKEQLASLERGEEDDLTPEEIRAQEAARAEELAMAREFGMGDALEDDEEMVSGGISADRVQRLKKLAMSGKSGVMVRRQS